MLYFYTFLYIQAIQQVILLHTPDMMTTANLNRFQFSQLTFQLSVRNRTCVSKLVIVLSNVIVLKLSLILIYVTQF